MRISCLFVCVFLAISVFCFDAFAEGDSEQRVLEEMIDAANGLSDLDGSGIAQDISEVENIEQMGQTVLSRLSFDKMADELLGMLSLNFPSALSLLCRLCALILICCMCRAICSSMQSEAVCAGFDLLSSAVIISAIFSMQYPLFEGVGEFFERLITLVESIVPISATVMAMGGNVTGAGLGSATLYGMIAITERVCVATVIPTCYIMGSVSVCSSFSSDGLLDGFAGTVRKIYTFVICAMLTLFVFVLGAQTTVATAADTAVARGAKLVSSTVIPVVGGAVADTVRTVAGSVSYIKSVLGVGSILLLLALTLPPLISLLCTRAVFLLTSGLSRMLGCERESKLLADFGEIYGFLLGAVAVCASAFAIAFAIFVKCTVAVG